MFQFEGSRRGRWRAFGRLAGVVVVGGRITLAPASATEVGAPAQRLSLTSAEAMLSSRDPAIAEAVHRARALDHEAVARGAWPDPTLDLGAQTLPVPAAPLASDPNTMLSVGVSQDIPAWGERRAMADAVWAQGQAAHDTVRAARAAALLDLRVAWLDAVYQDKRAKLLLSEKALAEESVQASLARLSSGRGATADVLGARLARESLANDETQTQAAGVMALARIAETLALVAPPQISTEWPVLPRPRSLTTLAGQLANHPLARASSRLIGAARADVRVAKSHYHPTLSLSGAYGKSFYPGMPNSVSIGVSISLPLFTGDLQDQELAAARQRLAAAKDRREQIELALARRLQVAFAQYLSATAREAHTRTVLVPSAEQAFAAELAAYGAGRLTMTELLKGERTLLALRDQVLSLRRDGAIATANLDYLESHADRAGDTPHE